MNCSDHYIPSALSTEISKSKLRRVYLDKIPVVLFRAADGLVRAYEDICPHRGAMLSEGRILNDELQCPYHGWRFGPDGHNTFVPVKNDKVNCKLNPVQVKEAFGLIWLSTNLDATMPELNKKAPQAVFSGSIGARPENVLENFLEGSHTHYVHDGLVRSRNKKRQEIEAKLITNDHGFEVKYQQEPAKGILTQLVPRQHRHLRPISTYLYPFTAVLEYFNGNDKSVFRVEMILSPNGNETTYHARVYLDIGMLTGIASTLVKPLLANVIRQDKDILEQQEKNLASGRSIKFFSDNTDLVGKQIFAWLFNKENIARQPLAFTVWW